MAAPTAGGVGQQDWLTQHLTPARQWPRGPPGTWVAYIAVQSANDKLLESVQRRGCANALTTKRVNACTSTTAPAAISATPRTRSGVTAQDERVAEPPARQPPGTNPATTPGASTKKIMLPSAAVVLRISPPRQVPVRGLLLSANLVCSSVHARVPAHPGLVAGAILDDVNVGPDLDCISTSMRSLLAIAVTSTVSQRAARPLAWLPGGRIGRPWRWPQDQLSASP